MFKKGDRVIRLKKDLMNRINVGKIYTVREYRTKPSGLTDFVLLVGVMGTYRADYFKLANSELVKEKLGIK